MSKSAQRRASQARPLLGNSDCFIQSPCSRHRMRIFVSARLHATAAPEAPEPMISTSTMSLRGSLIAGGLLSRVAPHFWPGANHVQQRPVALFQHVAFGERRPRFKAKRNHDAIVTVVALQNDPAEHG